MASPNHERCAMATTEQVYHDVGRALELANLFEMELGTCLLAIDGLLTESYKNPDADAYTRLRAAIDGQTLGQSIKDIKKRVTVPDADDLKATLETALEARNFLVHRLFAHYGLKIHDPVGRDEMLAHINRLHDTISRAYTRAQHLSGLLVSFVTLRAKP